jgi:hypothetical protein
VSNHPNQIVTVCAECGGFHRVRSGYPSTARLYATSEWTDFADDITLSVPYDRDVRKVYGGQCACPARAVSLRGVVVRDVEVDDAA